MSTPAGAEGSDSPFERSDSAACVWFDTHAHLTDEQFAGGVEGLLARAAAAGVTRILSVGTQVASSGECVELANRSAAAQVWAAVGVHPNYTAQAASGDWDRIVELAAAPRVVALGETGLDRYWQDSPFELQQDYFARHIELSQRTGLPFVVHMRECEADVLAMLREAARRGPLRGIMHSFAGSADAAQECVELGLYLSFSGMLTYKKADDLRRTAAQLPLDRLLVETDCPYLSPHPVRSRRPNEPELVVHTGRCLAEARGESLETTARATTDNACRLLRVR